MTDLLSSYAERTYPQDSLLIEGIRALEHEIAELEAEASERDDEPELNGYGVEATSAAPSQEADPKEGW